MKVKSKVWIEMGRLSIMNEVHSLANLKAKAIFIGPPISNRMIF